MESQDIITLREYVDTLFAAHCREHVLIDKALMRAQETMDYRLGQMNEFRDQINSERAKYITRDAHEAAQDIVLARVAAIEKPVWIGIAFVGVAAFAVPIILSFV